MNDCKVSRATHAPSAWRWDARRRQWTARCGYCRAVLVRDSFKMKSVVLEVA
jgi:hypothetical protein